MASIIPYELYIIIQSILNKNAGQLLISPNLVKPTAWLNTFTSFLTRTKGLITTAVVLPLTGSYIFQLSTTISPTPTLTYAGTTLEVRLYYGPAGTTINPDTAPFYGICTYQTNAPNQGQRFIQTRSIAIPNIDTSTCYQLGYWVGGAITGANANISFKIDDCFFTKNNGVQNIVINPTV